MDGFASVSSASSRVPLTADSLSQVARRESQYETCRRSLRIFPVRGDDLQLALKKYMQDFLDLPDEFIEEVGQVFVRRHRDP